MTHPSGDRRASRLARAGSVPTTVNGATSSTFCPETPSVTVKRSSYSPALKYLPRIVLDDVAGEIQRERHLPVLHVGRGAGSSGGSGTSMPAPFFGFTFMLRFRSTVLFTGSTAGL